MARVTRLVSIDLDGTLVRGDTITLALARHLGREAEALALESRFARGEIDNATLAAITGAHFAGLTVADLAPALAALPLIGGIAETLAALRARGFVVLLGTITWQFAARYFQRRFGFDAASGTAMDEADGHLTGKVTRTFGPADKPGFVAAAARRHGIDLSACAAIGDSASDIPLFRQVGLSIALNATPTAKAAATVALDTGDLTDVLAWLLPEA